FDFNTFLRPPRVRHVWHGLCPWPECVFYVNQKRLLEEDAMKTVSNMSTTFVGAALFLLLSLSGHAFAAGLEAQNVMERYGKLPLHFEANTGQTNHEVKFLSRGRGYSVFLTSTEAVLALKTASTPVPAVVTMRLVGAKPGRITGVEELPGKANYFIGNDPTKWRAADATPRATHYTEAVRAH